MKRLSRIAYLFLVAALTSAIVGYVLVHVAEAVAGTETQSGRVLDRIEGEREVTNCSVGRNRVCRTTVYPTYTVIGERQDGSTWLVVGEGAYDATGGERGAVEVSTSGLTNRVLGLSGEDDEWSLPVGLTIFVGCVVLGGWGLLVSAYEWRRRDGRWKMGSFEGGERWVAVPGVAAGLVVAIFAIFSRAWGLDVVTSDDALGGFVADPFDYALVQEEATDRGGGVQVNEPFRAARVDHTVVGAEHLSEEHRTAWREADGVLAIPLLRAERPTGVLSRVEFGVVLDGEIMLAQDCPSSLLQFPSRVGGSGVEAGFVCFEQSAEGATFVALSGSNQFLERDASPSYELLDGTIVDPSD